MGIFKRNRPPIGMEDFKEIRSDEFYYVDKTGLISDLFDEWSKVTLFTRPRRCGKTLAMSMFRYFFDMEADGRELFAGTEIEENTEVFEKYQGRFPVISMTDGLPYHRERTRRRDLRTAHTKPRDP